MDVYEAVSLRKSVRSFQDRDVPEEVLLRLLEAARLGADVCTSPLKVIKQLIAHPLTDIGLEKFLEDYKKVPKAR